MSVAIEVERLAKRYTLTRQTTRSNYRTLQEELLRLPQRLWRRERGEEFWALRDLSFSVEEGEVLGIIGRNGAGKSTLLKILSRIIAPSAGAVDLYGRVGSLLEVGTGFHPELNGRENIYLSGAILGMRRAEIARRFDEIVAFAEVEQFLDTPVKRYSSGMYMRLAFAVAAHLEPEILLVDEVLAVGDAAFQKKSLGKMGEVARGGRTVLFVSHNMAAVRQLCPRSLLLQRGELVATGPTEAVIDVYMRQGAAQGAAECALPAGEPDAPGAATMLRLSSVAGEPQAEFRLGEPWRIELEFELQRATPHVIAAVGIISAEAVPIITYWSAPADLAAGCYRTQFTMDAPLSAGQFHFAVGLSSYERAIYSKRDVGQATISEVAVAEQPLRTRGTGVLFSTQRPEIMSLSVLSSYKIV